MICKVLHISHNILYTYSTPEISVYFHVFEELMLDYHSYLLRSLYLYMYMILFSIGLCS